MEVKTSALRVFQLIQQNHCLQQYGITEGISRTVARNKRQQTGMHVCFQSTDASKELQ